MRIELEKLDETNSRLAHVFEPGELSLEDERAELKGRTEVRGSIDRKDGQVEVRGNFTAQVELECDRCLQSVVVPVTASFDLDYVPASEYVAERLAELGEDDLAVSVFDGAVIDIDELLREQVILALPSRALCREDCKGLCPVCGIDKNLKDCECESHPVDPRWAALSDLRS
ncbi:MAG: hypothetical protein QOD75_2557 [Blastocatellia bacterium]|jgi:uncharacterized protein|nr:hypothetical protein [Blastocatellia bacterium]